MTDESEHDALCEVLAAALARVDLADRAVGGTVVWSLLARLGVIGIGSPATGGDATIAVRVAEELGAAFVGGPVLATTAACVALDDDEAAAVAAGDVRVTIGAQGLYPWGAAVQVTLSHDAAGVARVELGHTRSLQTMSGEPWLQGVVVGREVVTDDDAVIVRFHLLVAGYLVGAAAALIDRTAEHARARHQFGRAIGDFQAVAHPLADAWMEVTAARDLVRGVSTRAGLLEATLARRSAAAAAVRAATTAQQVFGALGYATESTVGARSIRLRQWSLLPPDPRSDDDLLRLVTAAGTRAKTKQPQ